MTRSVALAPSGSEDHHTLERPGMQAGSRVGGRRGQAISAAAAGETSRSDEHSDHQRR